MKVTVDPRTGLTVAGVRKILHEAARCVGVRHKDVLVEIRLGRNCHGVFYPRMLWRSDGVWKRIVIWMPKPGVVSYPFTYKRHGFTFDVHNSDDMLADIAAHEFTHVWEWGKSYKPRLGTPRQSEARADWHSQQILKERHR